MLSQRAIESSEIAMKEKILITGGTYPLSRYLTYYVGKVVEWALRGTWRLRTDSARIEVPRRNYGPDYVRQGSCCARVHVSIQQPNVFFPVQSLFLHT